MNSLNTPVAIITPETIRTNDNEDLFVVFPEVRKAIVEDEKVVSFATAQDFAALDPNKEIYYPDAQNEVEISSMIYLGITSINLRIDGIVHHIDTGRVFGCNFEIDVHEHDFEKLMMEVEQEHIWMKDQAYFVSFVLKARHCAPIGVIELLEIEDLVIENCATGEETKFSARDAKAALVGYGITAIALGL